MRKGSCERNDREIHFSLVVAQLAGAYEDESEGCSRSAAAGSLGAMNGFGGPSTKSGADGCSPSSAAALSADIFSASAVFEETVSAEAFSARATHVERMPTHPTSTKSTHSTRRWTGTTE
eukprot:6199525-Pleurochrysis_carterae.AAC.10